MCGHVYKKIVSKQCYVWKYLNHGEQKERTLGKGWFPLGRDSWGGNIG